MNYIKVGNITDKETTLKDSLTRRYLNSFERPQQDRNPRHPLETCDLHLTGQQEFKYITPMHEGKDEITWNEPQEVKDLWALHERKYWIAITLISFIFMCGIFYMGGF